MLTFSVLWVMLAAACTVAAMVRRSTEHIAASAEVQPNGSGDALAIAGIVSSLLLLAGFLYVGSSLISVL
ncbi:MAG TPA: hypothetical protein VKX49_32430 [Bryobacteraceae bacterium]|nr:hypothetical protein [Bryobacteraceae bacterium]